MSDTLTLGQRIHNFRKRAGMSQLDLELELGSGEGSISRIENGRVNPGKETLENLARLLDLTQEEKLYLTGVLGSEISEKETAEATAAFLSMHNGGVMSYLLNSRYEAVAFSDGFIELGTAAGVDYQKLIGKHILEILFNPELGVRGMIDSDAFAEVASMELATWNKARAFIVNEPWFKELKSKLETYPNFQELWDRSQKIEIDIYAEDARRVKFKLGDKELNTIYRFYTFNQDPRFTIVDYVY